MIKKNGYHIHELENGNILLCKILKEYPKEKIEDAKDDLCKLITNTTTEKNIMKEK